MLSELRIKNFAIIESLDFSFQSGMNVLTGETGAGKSIIIQAVNLILGDRASTGLVRSGEKEASVEAVFSLAGEMRIRESLDALGIDADDELLIRRVISQEGKNRVYINGTLSTIGMLSGITENLISISSQHEHQTLLRPDHHLYFLDSYGKLDGEREKYQEAYRGWKKLKKKLDGMREAEKNHEERLDLLTFQLDEIESASIEPHEDEHLKEERSILINAEKLAGGAAHGDDVIYASENALITQLSKVIARTRDCAAIDSQLLGTVETLENILFQMEDAALSLRDYGSNITVDPVRLDVVEERLLYLEKILKKYGPTTDDVITSAKRIEAELESIKDSGATTDEIEEKLGERWTHSVELARRLSSKRKEAAATLSKKMKKELEELGMKETHFDIRFSSLLAEGGQNDEILCENGLEEIEFYLSTNPGEEPKPLARIASGGELSRIMLALKGCILGESKMPTLIFDEVDSGIGGGTAEVVGRKIKNVSKGAHVICITHLPQIAALGDAHYKVSKNIKAGRTFTTIERLDDAQRVDEVARMLGGIDITEKTKEHAWEMLEKNA